MASCVVLTPGIHAPQQQDLSHRVPHLDVRDLVEVEQIEQVEGLLGFVVLGEARRVDESFYAVNNLPKGAFKRSRYRGWK